MSYPGNTALSSEVQERILHSFEQTVALVQKGNEGEAQLGCEFILGMDPLFRPATVLAERLKAVSRPVKVEDLAADAPAAGLGSNDEIVTADDLWDAAPLADAPVAELSDSFSALPELESLADSGGIESPASVAHAETPPATTAPTAPLGGLQAVLQDLLDRGEYEKILQIGQNQGAAVEADPQLGAMITEAQSRLETGQYVQSFLEAAQQAVTDGRQDEAERLVAKARILDPENPALAQVLQDSPPSTSGHSADDLDALPDLLRDEPSDMLSMPSSDELGSPILKEAHQELEAVADSDDFVAQQAGTEDEFSEAAGPTVADPASPGTASPGTASPGPEGGDRLESLLSEGQAALDRGEFQNAIDIWSRIFLIDIDNAEATQKIEEARQHKAEAERQADEVFHDGVAKIESGDLEGARASFAEVLALQPGHAMASEYIEQIDSGEVPTPRRAPESSGDDRISEALAFDREGDSPSLEAAVQRDRVVAIKRTDRRLILIGAAVFLVVVVGGYLLFQQRDRLFPNAREEPAAQASANPQVARATALFDRGNTGAAIKILEAIPAGDPAHAQAQSLLTQYRAAAAPPEEEIVAAPTGPAPAEMAFQARLIDAARSAFAVGENVRARRYLERAATAVPLGEDAVELRLGIESALAPISEELEGFERADWEHVIPDLWRLLDQDENNPDARLLIVDSYYNLALRALQRGAPREAVALLGSALEVEPDNQSLGRMLAFAETYQSRQHDLLYRIYVKYLPSRS